MSVGWTIVTTILGLIGIGDIVLMIIKHFLNKPHDKADVLSKNVDTVHSAVPLYDDIRKIVNEEVKKATKPMQEQMDYLINNYCCLRAKECEFKINDPSLLYALDPNITKHED